MFIVNRNFQSRVSSLGREPSWPGEQPWIRCAGHKKREDRSCDLPSKGIGWWSVRGPRYGFSPSPPGLSGWDFAAPSLCSDGSGLSSAPAFAAGLGSALAAGLGAGAGSGEAAPFGLPGFALALGSALAAGCGAGAGSGEAAPFGLPGFALDLGSALAAG